MNVLLTLFINIFSTNMPLLYRAFASQAEGWVLESLSWQTQIIETGDSFTYKCSWSATDVNWFRKGFSTITLKDDVPCHIRCDMLQNPHDLMTMSDGHRSQFAALHQQTSRHVKSFSSLFIKLVCRSQMVQWHVCTHTLRNRRTHKIIKCS